MLENPDCASDLAMARDYVLGISEPPPSISMDFIASGLVEMIGGLAAAAFLFAYASTHAGTHAGTGPQPSG